MSAARTTSTRTVWRTRLWTTPGARKPAAHDRGHPSGRRAIAAIRAEQIRIHRRAQRGDMDLLRGHAGRFELVAHRGPAVKIKMFRSRRWSKPACELRG